MRNMKNNYLVMFLRLIHLRFMVGSTHSALCFLTGKPSTETLEFAQELAADAVQYDLHVFVMVDENQLDLTTLNTKAPLRLLQIPNDQPLHHGFHQTTSLGPRWPDITSWDKALFYFCVLQKQYDFVWLIEDDVFIPSARAVRSLHQLYSDTADLVIPRKRCESARRSSLLGLAVGRRKVQSALVLQHGEYDGTESTNAHPCARLCPMAWHRAVPRVLFQHVGDAASKSVDGRSDRTDWHCLSRGP